MRQFGVIENHHEWK